MTSIESLAAAYDEMLAGERGPSGTPRRTVHFGAAEGAQMAPPTHEAQEGPHAGGAGGVTQGSLREALSTIAVLHDTTAALAERAGNLHRAMVPREEWDTLCRRYEDLAATTQHLADKSGETISSLQAENDSLRRQVQELQTQVRRDDRRECESSPYEVGALAAPREAKPAALKQLDLSFCRLLFAKVEELRNDSMSLAERTADLIERVDS